MFANESSSYTRKKGVIGVIHQPLQNTHSEDHALPVGKRQPPKLLSRKGFTIQFFTKRITLDLRVVAQNGSERIAGASILNTCH